MMGVGRMIYTVTLNPSLDYVVSVADFRLGRTNRTGSEELLLGGKGINVSIVLQNLGIPSTALGFVAGFTGDEVVRRLEAYGIRNGLIRLEDGLTRINVKLRQMEGTEINAQGPMISDEKFRQLLGKLQALDGQDTLFLSGSIPPAMPDDTYQKIMESLCGRDVQTVVDASGNLLLHALSYRPFLVKPNHHELGGIFGTEITHRQQAVPYARMLRERGAQNVLVSLAGEGAVLAAADGNIYDAPAPKGEVVNGVGAGDAMVAGFMAGWMEKHDYMHAFYMGIAAGSASAFSEQMADRKTIGDLYDRLAAGR